MRTKSHIRRISKELVVALSIFLFLFCQPLRLNLSGLAQLSPRVFPATNFQLSLALSSSILIILSYELCDPCIRRGYLFG
jgi:hypothetical protein